MCACVKISSNFKNNRPQGSNRAQTFYLDLVDDRSRRNSEVFAGTVSVLVAFLDKARDAPLSSSRSSLKIF